MKKMYSMLVMLLFSSFAILAQNETEPNDNINQGSNPGNTFTASTSSTLSIGASITVNNNDFFKINLPECTSWAFNIVNPSNQGNVNLLFYDIQDSTNPIRIANLNFNSGLPAAVVFNCGQSIWVQVDQTSGTDIGTYQLQISQNTNGDVYECNNDYASATILPVLPNTNSSFSAKLWGYDCNGNPDTDFFTYTPTQCGVLKVRITDQNNASDLEIKVYDDTTNHNLIATLALNGDFGALLEANQKYYIVITDSVGGLNPYELFDDPFTITTLYDTSDQYECNNTYLTAAPLPIAQSFDIKLWGQNSQINVPDARPQDADYFTYTPTQCGVLKVLVTGQNGSADLEVNVYDDATPTKNLITTLQLNGNFGALLEANQKYYLVFTDGISGLNPYELFDDVFTVTTSYDTSDQYECNNTFLTAAPLPIGQFDIKLWGQNSQINIPDLRPQDADYFTYTPSQCGVLKVIVTDQNASADLEVNVYDDATPTKNLITTLQLNGNFGALLEANQKYYLVFTDGISGLNPYELFDDAFTVTTSYDTSDQYECNNTFLTAAPLPIGQSLDIKLWGQNSQINIPDVRPQDADYFYIEPSLCSNLSITLTGFNLSADLKIEVFKDQLPVPVSVAVSFLNSITVQLEANQKYYVVITDGISGLNPYELFDDAFTVTTTLTALAPTQTPTIGQSGLNLSTTTASGNTYAWFNGTTPVGSNSPNHSVTSIGSYTVCVSNPATCGTACSQPVIINSLANVSFETSNFLVFPNPANSILYIQLENGVTVNKLIIRDITGKIIFEQLDNVAKINVESLAKGIYILEAFSEDKNYQTRFIKD